MKKYLIFAAALAWGCQSKPIPADLIIRGGPIYTADDNQPTVEAVAVKGDTIQFAGTLEETMKYQGETTEVLDLGGATMTPGFIESHGHIMGVGFNEMNLDLMSVKSYDELVEKVKEAVAKAEPGQWILGRG